MSITPGRHTAVRDEGIVVFLIGMRINRWWQIHRWLPVALAMPRMLRALAGRRQSGLLGARPGLTWMVQYWESLEKLLAYANDRHGEHYPAWAAFYRRAAKGGAVGIWHETYVVPRGGFESIYVNMPAQGLGAFSTLVPAQGRHARARDRLALPEVPTKGA
ncbi:MAG TPA: DUF4188 domain-containing protein [Polyangiaceae bacterium]|nr:DUF4188 domain-containing protein [Polyangiaceae bacterium]